MNHTPIPRNTCYNCGGDLSDGSISFESVDETVGYRETVWLCAACEKDLK